MQVLLVLIFSHNKEGDEVHYAMPCVSLLLWTANVLQLDMK